MSFKNIAEGIYYFDGAVNIGYVHKGTTGLLIDAGIDRSAVKKVIRYIEDNGMPLTHLFISHAHADHYGGAAFVREKYEVETWAPALESAIIENPVLEPLYLFGGNDPFPDVRNKFLEGPPVTIDIVVEEGTVHIGDIEAEVTILPGHSYRQATLTIDGVLFAADAYFGTEYLHKHRIPYITDASIQIDTLRKLLNVDAKGAIPGHGTYEEDYSSTVEKNIEYHEKLLTWVKSFIQENGEVSHEELVSAMCTAYEVEVTKIPAWLLYRTAVTAYVNGLIREGIVRSFLKDYKLTFALSTD
ncbi:MBL fold metallo-hydrolase [Salimicrobium flavidum]|uniref:Glyoxylase, beta-lactamase superfamily II n=1 Tax=Salimicrobium flavidum TaxID=570947 RepID=A0A1N7JF23_9BACI|nr:MBL fold metallo-hydrolase [Salimicrobium flavidum]SIS47900.1 Glyoxylase, beta-lactamase superfamily II [Salimicrobium flavidum]